MESQDSHEVSENSTEIRMQNVIVQNNASSIINIDEDDKIKEEMPGDVQSTTESTAEATSTE